MNYEEKAPLAVELDEQGRLTSQAFGDELLGLWKPSQRDEGRDDRRLRVCISVN
jgi:hypothetical protein